MIALLTILIIVVSIVSVLITFAIALGVGIILGNLFTSDEGEETFEQVDNEN